MGMMVKEARRCCLALHRPWRARKKLTTPLSPADDQVALADLFALVLLDAVLGAAAGLERHFGLAAEREPGARAVLRGRRAPRGARAPRERHTRAPPRPTHTRTHGRNARHSRVFDLERHGC